MNIEYKHPDILNDGVKIGELADGAVLITNSKMSGMVKGAIRKALNDADLTFEVVPDFPVASGDPDPGGVTDPGVGDGETQPEGLSSFPPPAVAANPDLQFIEHLKSPDNGDKEPAYVAAHLKLVGPEVHAKRYAGRKLA